MLIQHHHEHIDTKKLKNITFFYDVETKLIQVVCTQLVISEVSVRYLGYL